MERNLTIYQSVDYVTKIVLDTVDSPNSKLAYGHALSSFMDWYSQSGQTGLNKAAVQAYKNIMRSKGLGAATINLNLCAIRSLAREAADNQVLDPMIAVGIQHVKGIHKEGKRLGNWLDKKQAEQLINEPDTNTLRGLRDRALLTLLLGCGLRRDEAARLSVDQIQIRESRWVIVDIIGKRNKTRSVPMPAWAKTAVDKWLQASGITEGRIFRYLNRGERIANAGITDQAIYDIVKRYADLRNLPIAPHDLRRSFARLAYKGGAALDQISLSLGHASIRTTEIYLGVQQNLTNAPCDHININLDK